MVLMSEHSKVRAAQRSLNLEQVEYVTQFGKRYYHAGAVIFYLREKDLPISDRKDNDWRRLVGTAVVYSCDLQTIITVWRNRKGGLKRIRKNDHPYCLGKDYSNEMLFRADLFI